MLAAYDIYSCRAGKIGSVVIIVPADCDGPNDYRACEKATEAAGYDCWERCPDCGDYPARAQFAGAVELSGRSRRIKITYQTVTPESAEYGDYDDFGWEDEEGVCIDPDEYDVEEHGSEFAAVVALAVKVIGNGCEASDYPSCCPGHTWYTEIDGETDYADGSVKTLSFHLEGFTPEEECAIYAALS